MGKKTDSSASSSGEEKLEEIIREKKTESERTSDSDTEDKITEHGIKMRNISSRRHMELQKWKKADEGVITISDLLDAAEEHIKLKSQRRFLTYGLLAICAFTLLLGATVLGLSVAAIQLTKETTIQIVGANSRLLDRNGNAVVLGEATVRVDSFALASEEEQARFVRRLMEQHDSPNLLHEMNRRRQVSENTTAPSWYLLGTIARSTVTENRALVSSNYRGQAVFPLEDSEEHVSGAIKYVKIVQNEYFITLESDYGIFEIHCENDETSPCLVLIPATPNAPEDGLDKRHSEDEPYYPGCLKITKSQSPICNQWCAQFNCANPSNCKQSEINKCNSAKIHSCEKDEPPCFCGLGSGSAQGRCTGISCFPANALVTLQSGQQVPISTIDIGTKVLTFDTNTGEYTFSPVIFWMHAGPQANPHLEITYSVNNSTGVFRCSPNHYVFKASAARDNWWEQEPVAAWSLQKGDYLLLGGGKVFSPVMVTDIQLLSLDGIYAPLTMTDTIVVDEIAASCHAEPLSPQAGRVLWSAAKYIYFVEKLLGWVPEDIPYTPTVVKAWPPKDAWYTVGMDWAFGISL